MIIEYAVQQPHQPDPDKAWRWLCGALDYYNEGGDVGKCQFIVRSEEMFNWRVNMKVLKKTKKWYIEREVVMKSKYGVISLSIVVVCLFLFTNSYDASCVKRAVSS